jgi:hypothetical protein
MGNPITLMPGEKPIEPPKCDVCSLEAFSKAFDSDMREWLEQTLGLTEEDKGTLQALKSIIDNPDRVFMVVNVHNRVNELERRLEDRTAGIRDAVDSKLDSAKTQLTIYSLILNAALFLAGLLFGIVLTFLYGV